MKNRLFIVTCLTVLLLVGGAVGVYAYDQGREDLISDGVRVGGVDVGGMRADDARAVLERELGKPLRRPLRVKHELGNFRLTARAAKVRADLDAMVDEAVERSREGNVVARSWEGLSGAEGEVVELQPRVRYSKAAVERLVARVKKSIDLPATDAEVAYSGTGLSAVASKDGRAVEGGRLERSIAAELRRVHGDRLVKPSLKTVRPKVATSDLASKYPSFLTVSRDTKELRFYQNLELVKTYPIAVGRAGFETPAGLYNIQNKAVNAAWSVPEWGGKLAGQVIPGGSPQNPLKARWLGIYAGAGIHGTDDIGSLGTAASHGCIRMAIPQVIELYDMVPVSTPIYIA